MFFRKKQRKELRKHPGCLGRLSTLLALVAVVSFVGYQLRSPILTGIGEFLYHEDPLEPAGGIVALAGGGPERLVEAADLFIAGYGPLVVLTRPPESPVIAELQARGLAVESDLERRIEYLEVLGVPKDRITVLQRVVESTQAEARLITEWAESRGVDKMIVVTSGYHTSRSRLVFDRVLGSSSTEAVVRPTSVSWFTPSTWWRTRSNLRDGLFEIQKHLYYRLMYLMGLTP